ncbi:MULTISPECIES: hypothetical protein [unclassified Shewanella]|uniref:hypothetical protein n=1 Tax=unclassified Shewanella TaxID=196818 RepID=UPI001BB810B1|nr:MULTISPECIES: hypothetical protein [unclassified Shewanella]GIU10853.1 hypothetical protein TUM4444_15810 [Shewanella sp. MBTL60-112-B1]GIU32985.1 hypothetical protein TUM4445_19410 [Shewanella sp. MBTL60-112-B2]
MDSATRQLNISISEAKIAQLIQQGHLCAADFKCLDRETKQAVWQLCLWSCEKRIHCDKHCQQECKSLCNEQSQELVKSAIAVFTR